MHFPSQHRLPNILVVDNYAPNHPDYERIAKTTGYLFRKKIQKRIRSLCHLLFFGEVHILFQKAECLPKTELLQYLFSPKWDLIIVTGSPFNAHDEHEWITNQIFAYQKVLEGVIYAPLLGICFGHQLIALSGGGKIGSTQQYYHGDTSLLLMNGESLPIFRSHRYYVSHIPETAHILATSEDVIENKKLPYALSYSTTNKSCIITLQPHPEHPPHSKNKELISLLRRWLCVRTIS
ncbi:hypothetical protein IPN35_04130 [Candidatus Peregrinibacteria bacterium]|nr:MAG: hypothetical protein IPN35_04130 [Candidatus Peregrinibacteria bacterium]